MSVTTTRPTRDKRRNQKPRRSPNKKGRRPAVRGRTKQQRFPAFVIVGVVLVALFTVAIAFTRSDQGGRASGIEEIRPVSISGESLPELVDSASDPAVGTIVPEVRGKNFAGEEINITNDGRPKALIFLAHWCPHCQAEVPVVKQWLETNDLPEEADLYTISTGTDPGLANYPPSEWLEREGWALPVLVDDASDSVGTAFGLSGTPYWVFVNADGTVSSRAAGEITPDQIEARIAALK